MRGAPHFVFLLGTDLGGRRAFSHGIFKSLLELLKLRDLLPTFAATGKFVSFNLRAWHRRPAAFVFLKKLNAANFFLDVFSIMPFA